jgi:peptidyl-prolyl cis-trans isomerase A (cyclophilin A)
LKESIAVKRNLITLIGVVAIIAGIVGVRTAFEQTIQTEDEAQKALEAEQSLEEAEKISREAAAKEEAALESEAPSNVVSAATTDATPTTEGATTATPAAASAPQPTSIEGFEEIAWVETAPETYRVKFDTTAGSFIIECNGKWSEQGSKRFYELCKMGFFDNSGFFRVIHGFMVQFGLAADPKMTAQFANKNLRDEPVRKSNQKGLISFATSGPNTRTTQVFINYGDNANLDEMGFTPFGEVIVGMENVEKITDEYGEKPSQGSIKQQGTDYLKQNFPNLDFINKVTLVQAKP